MGLGTPICHICVGLLAMSSHGGRAKTEGEIEGEQREREKEGGERVLC